jgi:cysteine-rich repeat protein
MRHVGVVMVAALIARAAAALQACTASDVTAVDPGCPAQGACTITRDVEVTGVCTLDFGTRAVVVGEARTIRVARGGDLTINAGSLTLQPGAFIDGRGRDGEETGAVISLRTTGDVELQQRGATRAGIDVSDDRDTGLVSISADGRIRLGGPLRANAQLPGGFRGYPFDFILIHAGGDLVSVSGSPIEARGHVAFGIVLEAAGTVNLGDAVDVRGPSGNGDPPSIQISAGTDIVVHSLLGNAHGGAEGGDGATVELAAGRNVQVPGPINVRGGPRGYRQADGGGGFGGVLRIVADGNLWIAAPIFAGGGFPFGRGGEVDISVDGALTVAPGGAIRARGVGSGEGSGGGSIRLFAGRSITTAARIDSTPVGEILVGAGTDVAVHAPLDASGQGEIHITAGESATSGGAVLIDAGVHVGQDGRITLDGCDVTVTRHGLLGAKGVLGGQIDITAAGQVRIDGVATGHGYGALNSGSVFIEFAERRPPIFGLRSVVRPPPELLGLPDGSFRTACAQCGNGTVEGNEQCDDGNQIDCDGCDSNCTLSSTCGNGIRCGAEQCDAEGIASGCCDPTCHFRAAQTTCDDGDLCTSDDVCDAAGRCAGSTTPLPEAQCHHPAPHAAFLQLQDGGDRLSWRWDKGQLTTFFDLGNPTATTDYALCVYDESPSRLRLAAPVSAGGICGAKPCWKSTPTGFRYANRTRAASGIKQLRVVQGAEQEARIELRGQGADVALPSPLLRPPVTVQLRNSAGACWEARYSTSVRNDALEYRATSD